MWANGGVGLLWRGHWQDDEKVLISFFIILLEEFAWYVGFCFIKNIKGGAMRRKDRERTEKAFLDQVLAEAEELWVGFNTGGAPYVLPLNFAHVDGSLYLHCAVEGRKLELIRQDPRVGFSTAAGIVIVREKFTTRYRSVCGVGRAVILEDAAERQRALDIISERYQALCPRPASEKMLARTAVIRIDIEEITGKESCGKE